MFLPPGINDVRGWNCPIKGTHLTEVYRKMTKKQNYGIVGKDFKFVRPIGRVDLIAEAVNRYYLKLCFNIQQFQKPERLSDSDLNDLEGCLNSFF